MEPEGRRRRPGSWLSDFLDPPDARVEKERRRHERGRKGPRRSSLAVALVLVLLPLGLCGLVYSVGLGDPGPVLIRVENRRDEPIEGTYRFLRLPLQVPNRSRTVSIPPRGTREVPEAFFGHTLEVRASDPTARAVFDRQFTWEQRRRAPDRDVFDIVVE